MILCNSWRMPDKPDTISIPEAIEQLKREVPPIPRAEWSVNTRAKALSIEALKRIEATRLVRKVGTVVLLPGETPERKEG